MRRHAMVMAGLLLAVAAGGARAQNLVDNGDFEAGQAPWGRPVTDAEAHSGAHSVVLDNTEGVDWAAVGYGPTIPLEPHTAYRISVWVKRETGDGYLEIGGYPVDAAGERLRTGRSWSMFFYPLKVMTGQALGRWEQFETVFTFHRPDIAGLILRLVHRHAQDVVYFDDVAIEKMDLPPRPAWTFPDGVLFPGRPSEFGMAVESAEQLDGGVRVVTTGAEYEFTDGGRITARQRIGAQREVVSVQADAPFGDLTIEWQDADVCVLSGEALAFGVQGDSMIVLATNRPLGLSVTSHIGAKHLATQGPHLLAIDGDGGFVISHDYSKRYLSSGCELTDLPESMAQPQWGFRYDIAENERVALAVFPPREYRWQDLFEKRVANVMGPIDDDAIEFYRQWCQVLMVFDSGRLYDNCRQPAEGRGPYVFRDPDRMRHLIETCHGMDMQVVIYSNSEAEGRLWYGDDSDAYFEHLRAVTEEDDIDGWYFDGVFTRDPWSEAYTLMRRVREMLGEDGIIYNHCTLNPPLTRDDFYLPAIDAYANYLLRGEGQVIDGVNDPYMRWVIGAYRISNAIPTLKWDKMADATTHDIFRAMLGLHGSFRWAYPVAGPGVAIWGGDPPAERVELDREHLEYLYPELDRREALWRAGELDTSVQWPIEVSAPAPGAG